MKKHLLFLTALLSFNLSHSQIFMDKKAKTHFLSKSAMEDIEATNKSSVVVMDAGKSKVQVQVQIKAFKFASSFMEEHFNENYMETDKEGPKDAAGKSTYPNRFGTFDGKVNETIDFTKDGEHKVTCTGKLTIHGVTNEVTLPGTMKIKGGNISLSSEFKVKLADYKIKVPSLYVKNIAEEIAVDLNAVMEPFKKP